MQPPRYPLQRMFVSRLIPRGVAERKASSTVSPFIVKSLTINFKWSNSSWPMRKR